MKISEIFKQNIPITTWPYSIQNPFPPPEYRSLIINHSLNMPLIDPVTTNTGGDKTKEWQNKLVGKKLGDAHDEIVGVYWIFSSIYLLLCRPLPSPTYQRRPASSSLDPLWPRTSSQIGALVLNHWTNEEADFLDWMCTWKRMERCLMWIISRGFE